MKTLILSLAGILASLNALPAYAQAPTPNVRTARLGIALCYTERYDAIEAGIDQTRKQAHEACRKEGARALITDVKVANNFRVPCSTVVVSTFYVCVR